MLPPPPSGGPDGGADFMSGANLVPLGVRQVGGSDSKRVRGGLRVRVREE